MLITSQIRANGSIDEDYATLTTGQIRAYKSSMKTSRLPTVYDTLTTGQIKHMDPSKTSTDYAHAIGQIRAYKSRQAVSLQTAP